MENIRLAVEEDIPAIMDIVAATLVIMRQEDNPQWDEEYPSNQTFLDDIAKRSLYVYDDMNVTGFVCVDNIQPPEYKAARWSSNADCYCLHRLAVHPSTRTKGLGSMLVKHVECVARQGNVNYIRSDTFSGNKGMNALFEKCGFNKLGEIRLRNINRPFFCYDKLFDS